MNSSRRQPSGCDQCKFRGKYDFMLMILRSNIDTVRSLDFYVTPAIDEIPPHVPLTHDPMTEEKQIVGYRRPPGRIFGRFYVRGF